MKMDEQFKKELAKTNKFVNKVYEKTNLFPNPDPMINETTAEGKTKEEKIKADNRVCPCKPALEIEIPEDGVCHCGIFCSKEYVE
jgi:ferredoxin-thioredoxin reductase catalytic subunit